MIAEKRKLFFLSPLSLTTFCTGADGGAGAGGMPGGMPDMGGAGGMPDMGGAGGPTVEEVD